MPVPHNRSDRLNTNGAVSFWDDYIQKDVQKTFVWVKWRLIRTEITTWTFFPLVSQYACYIFLPLYKIFSLISSSTCYDFIFYAAFVTKERISVQSIASMQNLFICVHVESQTVSYKGSECFKFIGSTLSEIWGIMFRRPLQEWKLNINSRLHNFLYLYGNMNCKTWARDNLTLEFAS